MLPFRNKKQSRIVVSQKFDNNGLLFNISYDNSKHTNTLTFPLIDVPVSAILSSPNAELLATLEMVYEEGQLTELEGSYLLTYDRLYDLDPDLLGFLGLPKDHVAFKLSLDSSGIAGTPNFQFKSSLQHSIYGDALKYGKRYGSLIETLDGSLLMMEKPVFRLLEVMDKYANNTDSSVDNRLRGLAEIKQLAASAEADFSSYLQRENYSFIDQVELDAILGEEEDVIHVAPRYVSEGVDDNILSDLNAQDRSYTTTNYSGDRRRVFVSDQARGKAQSARGIPPITGASVPQFVTNPAAFLPEDLEIDMDIFGERVKSLGIRVYQSRPYVHVNPQSRNWFDSGIKLVSESGEEIGEFGSDEFRELAETAIQRNESFVKFKGDWVAIPNQTKEFLDAESKMKEDVASSGSFDLSKLSYILEIYENIDQIDFNKPILEFRTSLEDSGIMDPPPESFKANLYPYQVEGFRWLKLINFRNNGGLLADDMGLGKTVQVIAFLSTLKKIDDLGPSLIVGPLTLMDNWVKELQKFCSAIGPNNIYVHQGSGRIKNIEFLKKFDIVLTSYDTLVRDQLTLGQIDWVCMICDEAQKFKNSSTATSHVVKAMKNKFRLALTGTPVENGLTELWSIMDYVQPGLLGSLKMFKQRFEGPILSETDSVKLNAIEQELLSIIQPVYKRRTKKEVLSDVLPKKERCNRLVELGPEQQMMYSKIIDSVKSKEISMLAALHALRQVCSHPGLYDSRFDTIAVSKVPKLAATMDILREAMKKQEKVLIFTFYKKMQVILKQTIMAEFGINPQIINGETSYRQLVVDQFNQSTGFNVMILSQQAAGVGLNITGANHVVHYTRWWNPAVENQATDRAYRIGQKKDVHVYYPIVTGQGGETMEEILNTLLRDKEDLADRVLIPSVKLDCSDELMRKLRENIEIK